MSTLIHPEWVKMELCDMGKSIFDDLPLSSDRFELKKTSIETSLALQDYQLLQNLIKTREGLLTTDLRRKVWPVLAGLSQFTTTTTTTTTTQAAPLHTIDYTQLPAHKDEDQLKLDIERSFVYYPCLPDQEIQTLRSQLSQLITRMLRTHPQLNYYQGYHDVAAVILLVFRDDNDSELRFQFLEQFTLTHLRDFMVPMIDFSVDQLKLVPCLLRKLDPGFGNLVASLQPFYSLSSIITVYSHILRRFDDVCLLWDFMLCENTIGFAIYFYSTALLYFKSEIFDQLYELTGLTEADFVDNNNDDDESGAGVNENRDILHSVLSNVVDKNLNNNNNNGGGGDGEEMANKSAFFEILQLTMGYLHKFPFDQLSVYGDAISDNSVLKTSSVSYTHSPTLEEINSRVLENTEQHLLDLFTRQLHESDKLQSKKAKLARLRLRQNNTGKKFSFITDYLYKNNTALKLRDKNLKLSTVILRISFAIGILGILLKLYDSPQENNQFLVGFHSVKRMINGNGFTLTKLGLTQMRDNIHRFIN